MARSSSLIGPITIRDFSDGDIDAVISLARELQLHEIQFFDRLKPASEINTWYVDGLKTETSKHNGRFLIAEINSIIVAYVTLLLEVTSADDPEETLYRFAHIRDLSVASSARGQQVGTALMQECERLALQHGCKWLRLGVLAKNSMARNFYEKLGMEELSLTLEKKLP